MLSTLYPGFPHPHTPTWHFGTPLEEPVRKNQLHTCPVTPRVQNGGENSPHNISHGDWAHFGIRYEYRCHRKRLVVVKFSYPRAYLDQLPCVICTDRMHISVGTPFLLTRRQLVHPYIIQQAVNGCSSIYLLRFKVCGMMKQSYSTYA